MKKFFTILIACSLIFNQSIFAQEGETVNLGGEQGHELILGISGAFNGPLILNQNAYGETELDYVFKAGYSFAFNLGYNFSPNYGVVTAFHYQLQGQKYDGKQNSILEAGDSYFATRDISIKYFTVPVLFKWTPGEKKNRFRLMVGPQFMFLADATQEYLRDGVKLGSTAVDKDGNTFVVDDDNIKDRYQSTDIGMVLDLGGEFFLNEKMYIDAGIRTYYGFIDMNAEPYRIENRSGVYEASHNFSFGIYAGFNYLIKFNKKEAQPAE